MLLFFCLADCFYVLVLYCCPKGRILRGAQHCIELYYHLRCRFWDIWFGAHRKCCDFGWCLPSVGAVGAICSCCQLVLAAASSYLWRGSALFVVQGGWF